jgi:hypothetical protein
VAKLNYLPLDLLAYIADHPEASAIDVASIFNAAYPAVSKAVHRIREAGGWYSQLVWTTCRECGEDLAVPAKGRHRVVHKACEGSRRNREKDVYGRKHPDKVKGWKLKWKELHPELEVPRLTDLHAADDRDQPMTLLYADAHGDPWLDDDDKYLMEHAKQLDRDTAIDLGRSLHAVRRRKYQLRKKLEDAGGRDG